ncbi:anti-sigma factor domain-containing protein [Desulfofundulus sp.]|uniref:anti-sigma factor domain-containing protein n=1 Tax=Desulfofundulus sp. TaxID=2282750 RepID=UPI003C77AC17
MVTGIVVEIKTKTCIILTPDARFQEIPLPAGGVRLGEEICYVPRRHSMFRQLVLTAACLLIFLGAGLLYHGWSARAVAFVSMDINPSVEMSVDRREFVCEAKALNADGEILLSRAGILGRPVEEAINTLLARAVQSGYLLPFQENVVLTAVTTKHGQEAELQAGKIYRTIVKSLQSTGVPAEVVVETATPEIRRQAMKLGLSTGRYLLHVEGRKKGLDIGLEELKRESMASLEKKKGMVIGEVLGKHGCAGRVVLPGAVSRPGSETRSLHRSPGLANTKGLERVSITEDKAPRVHPGAGTPVQKRSLPVKYAVPDEAREQPGPHTTRVVPPPGYDQEHHDKGQGDKRLEEREDREPRNSAPPGLPLFTPDTDKIRNQATDRKTELKEDAGRGNIKNKLIKS